MKSKAQIFQEAYHPRSRLGWTKNLLGDLIL